MHRDRRSGLAPLISPVLTSSKALTTLAPIPRKMLAAKKEVYSSGLALSQLRSDAQSGEHLSLKPLNKNNSSASKQHSTSRMKLVVGKRRRLDLVSRAG